MSERTREGQEQHRDSVRALPPLNVLEGRGQPELAPLIKIGLLPPCSHLSRSQSDFEEMEEREAAVEASLASCRLPVNAAIGSERPT